MELIALKKLQHCSGEESLHSLKIQLCCVGVYFEMSLARTFCNSLFLCELSKRWAAEPSSLVAQPSGSRGSFCPTLILLLLILSFFGPSFILLFSGSFHSFWHFPLFWEELFFVKLTWSRRRKARSQQRFRPGLSGPRCFASASSSGRGSRPPHCQSTGGAGSGSVSNWGLGYLHVKVGIQGVIWSICPTEEVAKAGRGNRIRRIRRWFESCVANPTLVPTFDLGRVRWKTYNFQIPCLFFLSMGVSVVLLARIISVHRTASCKVSLSQQMGFFFNFFCEINICTSAAV